MVCPVARSLRSFGVVVGADDRAQLQAALIRTAKGIAAAAGAPKPRIEYILATPAMYNDPVLVEESLPTIRGILGDGNVKRYDAAMGGEDFSEFEKVVPGFMFRVGDAHLLEQVKRVLVRCLARQAKVLLGDFLKLLPDA